MSLHDNIFVVGPQAAGRSFFGRTEEIQDIESSIFSGVGAVHLVGPTKIGKSSLVTCIFEKNRDIPNRICVRITMAECCDAVDFWKSLADAILDEIRTTDLWNCSFENYNTKITKSLSSNTYSWFTEFKGSFKGMLKQLGKKGYRLVLAIDEFDSVVKVFDKDTHYYQLLRSVYYEPECSTSGVIISRKRLHLLEARCSDLSTFHGVFREKTLKPFSNKDMNAFYEALGQYNISLSSQSKDTLKYYTGSMPYLCCMFGNRLVTKYGENSIVENDTIEQIFKECLPQIDRYYDDLIVRMEDDKHTEVVFYVSIGFKLPNITKRDIENLIAMGVLTCEQGDEYVYYAYSKDFMTYFRTHTLKLPAWDTITRCEKKIKSIFELEYPELNEIKYQNLISPAGRDTVDQLNAKYSELNLDLNTITRYCRELSAHKDNPSILDVMTLSKVVGIISRKWVSNFQQHFGGDNSWKNKLEYINKMRNPIAHAQIEYIDPEKLSVCLKYCEEINEYVA